MKQFNSFGALADYLATVQVKMPGVQRAELREIGAHIQLAAKAKLGTYQPGAGPFAAWRELAMATLRNSKRQALTEGQDSPLLVTGKHIEDTIQFRVVGNNEVHVGSDDPVAGYQELGTDRIPPRSFLGSALFEQAPAMHDKLGQRIMRLIETGA